MGLVSLCRLVAYHTKTAFLFTKSDIKTTLIPIVRRASRPRDTLPILFFVLLDSLRYCLRPCLLALSCSPRCLLDLAASPTV